MKKKQMRQRIEKLESKLAKRTMTHVVIVTQKGDPAEIDRVVPFRRETDAVEWAVAEKEAHDLMVYTVTQLEKSPKRMLAPLLQSDLYSGQ
jgi:hypothetical protein